MHHTRASRLTTFVLNLRCFDSKNRPSYRLSSLCQPLLFRTNHTSIRSTFQSDSSHSGHHREKYFVVVSHTRRRYCSHSNMFGQLETYDAPEWASALNCIPKKRIRLAMANTPIHPWNVPGAPADFSVSVKRDDLTGCALSGNKVRKLEFLMAEAVEQGCRHVITCGSIQSNHCRAVAVCARRLGMTPHLLLRTEAEDAKECGCEGNVLLNHLFGANIYLVPKYCPYLTHMAPRMEQLAQHIQSTSGESSYLVPVGGSNTVGLFGYLTAFEELRQQGVTEQYDDLVFPCGSGGTAAGLAIANYLSGSNLRLHGISVSDDAAYFYQHVEECLEALGLGHLKARDLLRVVDGYKGRGYGLSTTQELEFIHQVAMKTSIVLDPVYTGKATLGMVTEMNNHPEAFEGRRVLYIHTGGMFGLFDGRMTPFLEEKEERQPCVKMWPTLDDSPL